MFQACFKHASSMLAVSSRIFSSVNTYLIQILEHEGQHIKHLLPGLHLESYINIFLQPTPSMLWHASSMSLACFKHVSENHFIIISQKHYGKKQKKSSECVVYKAPVTWIAFTHLFLNKNCNMLVACFKQARGMLETCLKHAKAESSLLYSANGRILWWPAWSRPSHHHHHCHHHHHV